MLLHPWPTRIYLHRRPQTLSVLAYNDCEPSAPIRRVGAALTATIYGAVNTKYLASSFGPVGAFTLGGHEVPNGIIPLYLLRRQARVTLLAWRKQAL